MVLGATTATPSQAVARDNPRASIPAAGTSPSPVFWKHPFLRKQAATPPRLSSSFPFPLPIQPGRGRSRTSSGWWIRFPPHPSPLNDLPLFPGTLKKETQAIIPLKSQHIPGAGGGSLENQPCRTERKGSWLRPGEGTCRPVALSTEAQRCFPEDPAHWGRSFDREVVRKGEGRRR